MIEYRIIDDFATDAESLRCLLDSLPQWRREAALKFRHEQGQRECALSYNLLSEMLGFQPEFRIAEHGKPYVKMPLCDEMIYFNLSHCRKAVACAVSDNEVGIDVECIGRYGERLARYCMCDEEMQRIQESADPDAEFTMLWTRKEALLKLTGEGINDDMKTCLSSERLNGIVIDCGLNKEKGYAWSVAHYSD